MKKILFIVIALFVISCQNAPDLSLYNANKEIAQKVIKAYESQDIESFKSLVDKKVKHQSPSYGVGEVGYDEVLKQAEFYMTGFENVSFTARAWLPGVDEATLMIDGSVRVYGTWKGNSIASGKEFSLDSYHYFNATEGRITESGDYFDATGMVRATMADPVVEEEAAE